MFLISFSAGEFLITYFLARSVAGYFRKPVHVERACQACISVGSIDFLKFLNVEKQNAVLQQCVFHLRYVKVKAQEGILKCLNILGSSY